MQVPVALKRFIFPERNQLTELEFNEDAWLTARVPDDERFGLARELVLQRIYELAGPVDGGTVVDCGANVGMFTLTACGRADRVVAVEPDPSNFKLLNDNVARNRIENVETIQAAVWSEDGEIQFDVGSHSTGGGIDPGAELAVEAVSLDTLCSRFGPIDLLKLDIEGAEESVLPASHLEGVRRIVAELHLHDVGQERPMVRALEQRGFDVTVVASSDLYTPRWVPKVLRNWRALRGQTKIKIGVLAYLMAPLEKPRRPGRDMPILVATRPG